MSDKRDKTFRQYAIIGGCLGVLTGVALLALVLTLAPSNPNINAYYNPEPSGHTPWLGCTTMFDISSDDGPAYVVLSDEINVTAEVSNAPPGVVTTFGEQQHYNNGILITDDAGDI
jgi:hypothetical protein